MPGDSPELRLARRLAKPFARGAADDRPLSFRCLPDGAMVVISADGRKLWFTLEEVNQARSELGMKTVLPAAKPPAREEKSTPPLVSSKPPAGSRDGKSEMIVLPPDLKHLEEKVHDKLRRH